MKQQLIKIKDWFHNKFKWIVLSIILISGAVASGYFIMNQKHKTEIVTSNEMVEQDKKIEVKLSPSDIFPEIDPRDYYDFLEYDDNNIIIGDKLISNIVKDVITRLKVSYGDIEFYYERKSNYDGILHFNWISANKEKISKSFQISLNVI